MPRLPPSCGTTSLPHPADRRPWFHASADPEVAGGGSLKAATRVAAMKGPDDGRLARGPVLRAPAVSAVPVDDVADHDTQCGADGGDDEEFEAGT